MRAYYHSCRQGYQWINHPAMSWTYSPRESSCPLWPHNGAVTARIKTQVSRFPRIRASVWCNIMMILRHPSPPIRRVHGSSRSSVFAFPARQCEESADHPDGVRGASPPAANRARRFIYFRVTPSVTISAINGMGDNLQLRNHSAIQERITDSRRGEDYYCWLVILEGLLFRYIAIRRSFS